MTAAPTPRGTPVTFVVLAKAPVPGLVKTRLTTAYSEHEAAALASAALLDSLDAAREAAARTDGRVVCALTGDLERAAAPAALRSALDAVTVVDQRGDGLGERIAAAHLDAVGPDGSSVQIGMDTPQADPAVLAAAAASVTRAGGPDAVLGPALDGGWWLLALRRAADARHLADVPMSTDETGRATRAALEAAGLQVAEAPALRDVDEPADVVTVAAQCRDTRFAALVGVLGGRTQVAS